MPANKTIATISPTALAAAGVNLSTAEIRMLVAIVVEMGELPDINYTTIGERVGIKLARNARTSAKKVFTKIIEAQATADDGESDAEEEVTDAASKKPVRKAPALRKPVEEKEVNSILTKKAAAKKIASKTPSAGKVAVGARAAPKKASAGLKKKYSARKINEKVDNKDEEQEDEGEETKDEKMKDIADEEPVPEAEAEIDAEEEEVLKGKLFLSLINQDIPNSPKAPEVSKIKEHNDSSAHQAAPIAPADTNRPWKSTYFGFTATFPAGYTFPLDATPTEIYQAHAHEVTVESYRIWKADNQYDDDLAPSPLPVAQVHSKPRGDSPATFHSGFSFSGFSPLFIRFLDNWLTTFASIVV
ncbi:hypothetical protein BGZ60DRAFT_567572 [Tricladium varicosporioides]|nr:hypothetical protein BGZ60DRAFT_567572 [Hymenoscyphus varicosporioides]